MFNQCSKCKMCSNRAINDAPRLLSIGAITAPILVIDDMQPLFSLEDPKIKDTFAMINFSNADSVRAGGSTIFGQGAIGFNVMLTEAFTTLKDVEITWAQRCAAKTVNSDQEMSGLCGIYTRFLVPDRKIIVTTAEGYAQLSIELPPFEEGHLHKTKIGIVVTILPISKWGPYRKLGQYKALINRARKEVGL